MNLPEPSLCSDRLYLFVLGPGKGESVLLRIPPGQWVIIDSFKQEGIAVAHEVISRYDESVAAMILTHPHEDHCSGFIDLIDLYSEAIIGGVLPGAAGGDEAFPADAYRALSKSAIPTFDRITDAWNVDPHRRWHTYRHSSRLIGDAELVALNPVEPVVKSSWRTTHLNEISTAIRVTWNQVTILLGADIPGQTWQDIGGAFGDLGNHQGMKVPHHGSKNAFDVSFGAGARDRLWIITPFKRGLPLKRCGGGLQQALGFVDQVHLTSLPYRHDCHPDAPCRTTRVELEDGRRPSRVNRQAARDGDELEGFVGVSYDAAGNLVDEWFGRGSVCVVEGAQ